MNENKTLLVINAIIDKENMAVVQTYIGNMMICEEMQNN